MVAQRRKRGEQVGGIFSTRWPKDKSLLSTLHVAQKSSLTADQIGAERFRAPEILFDPEIIGLEYPGIHQIVVDAINRTDMDLRKSLFGNIVLSGGSTLTKGFGDRLLHEVQRLAVKDMRIKIFAPPERKYSTWIGGSILAGLSTFRKVSSSYSSSESFQEAD